MFQSSGMWFQVTYQFFREKASTSAFFKELLDQLRLCYERHACLTNVTLALRMSRLPFATLVPAIVTLVLVIFVMLRLRYECLLRRPASLLSVTNLPHTYESPLGVTHIYLSVTHVPSTRRGEAERVNSVKSSLNLDSTHHATAAMIAALQN